MLSVDLSQLINEYTEQGVGEIMYSFIHRIVRSTCPIYPPSVYSPQDVWDEGAIDDVCQEFTLRKLIQQGNLEHHLYASENVSQFAGMIKRDLRHFLINRAKRTVYQRLRKRVQALLEADAEIQPEAGCSDETIWHMIRQTTAETEQHLEVVIHAMWHVLLPPTIRYRIDSTKQSPLISNADLQRLLRETLTRIGKGIAFDLLMEALRYRLNLHDDEIISLNDSIGATEEDDRMLAEVVGDPAPNIESQIEAMEIALYLTEQLTTRQKKVLASYFGLLEPNQTAIARQLGISLGTVNQEIRTIMKRIQTTCTTADDADTVMKQLAKLLADEQL